MALSLLALEQPLADRPIAVESEQEVVDRMFDEIIRANFPDPDLPSRVAIAVLPPRGSSWEPVAAAGKGLPALPHRVSGYWRPLERSPPSNGRACRKSI
jgi:hypothetical protein